MKTAGVIGWPVAHSKSPLIHRFWLGQLGLDGDYGRFPVAPADLGAALRALPALGLRGVNVTVPHKVAALAHLDRLDAVAAGSGAVNTVVVEDGRLAGYNTDVDGVVEMLAGADLGGTIVVVGAGGAGLAVVAAWARLRAGSERGRSGAGAVLWLNRDIAKAEAALVRLGVGGRAAAITTALPSDTSILVNATSLGMTGSPPLDLDLTPLAPTTLVADVVYAPLDTPLLVAARARGLPTVDGLTMLIGQAAVAFERFYGVPPPRRHDTALRALLMAPTPDRPL